MKTSICTNGFSIFISTLLLIFLYSTISCGGSQSDNENNGNSFKIIDHTCTDITYIPVSAINQAKANLHIAYGHTSHGSQLTEGMSGLLSFKSGYDSLYAFNKGGTGGALDFWDYYSNFPGAQDLGNPNYTNWATATRNFLNDPSNSVINVIIWSWCGEVSWASTSDIDNYLSLMNGLEIEFPNVKFVYMTGHLDGGGLTGNLHLRNEQIRNYCNTNNKWLYDFADIESYDPDGVNYGDKYSTDGCNYDYNSSGGTTQTGDPAEPTGGDRNWATDWQNSHILNVDWYSCGSAHTKPLNANRKAYAAWWLWARLGGWSGVN